MPAPSSPLRPSTLEALESRIAPALIYGVDAANKLVLFDSAKATVLLASHPITGLSAGEHLVGIDFRPTTGQLYAVSENAAHLGHLYTIAPATGVATSVGSAAAFFTVPLDGTAFDVDFNPMTDQLRVVSDHGQNFRVDPTSGAMIDGNSNLAGTQADTNLAYKAGDTNAGKTPAVTGIAYTNSFAGTGATQLFDIDRVLGIAALQSPESGGTLATAGPLKVVSTAGAGFDILPGSKMGFADLTVAGADQLYTVDTTTGAARSLGKIGPAGTHLVSLAALPSGLGIIVRSATWRDVDGDTSTVAFTKGTVSPEIFTFGKPNSLGGVPLYKVNLNNPADAFATASVTFASRPSSLGGDGFVDVGRIDATNIDLGALTVHGDLGSITVGDANLATAAVATFKVNTTGAFDNFTQGGGGTTAYAIQGDVGAFGATGDSTSAISISGKVNTLSVAGTLFGSFNVGSVTTLAKLGAMQGGTFKATGDLKRLISGPALVSSIQVGGALGSIAIAGDFFASLLTVAGHANPLTAAQALAVGSISITGSVNGSQLLIGYNQSSVGINPDVQVGTVSVGGSWNQSDLAVGIKAGDAYFGNGDDVSITPPAIQGQPAPVAGGNPNIVSRLASLTIKGSLIGTPGSVDSFGFVANQIGAATLGGVKLPLTLGLDAFYLSSTRDIVVREYA